MRELIICLLVVISVSICFVCSNRRICSEVVPATPGVTKIACFIHVGALDISITQPIYDKIIHRLKSAGLYHYLYTIRLGVVGKDWRKLQYSNKEEIVYHNDDPKVFEIPTVNALQSFCIENPHVYVLYLHTKGATAKRCENINYQEKWCEMMLHYCVDHFKTCLKLLNYYRTVGCEMHNDHYSGNFWWARGDYIATKKECATDNSGWGEPAEYWVMNPPLKSSHACLFTTGMNNEPPCKGLYGNNSNHEGKLHITINKS